jgi:hypothetical protein
MSAERLAQYWESRCQGRGTDFVIAIDGDSYDIHTLVLGAVDGYFHNLLESDFCESKEGLLRLHIKDPGHNFEQILRYCYMCSTDVVTPRNAIRLYQLAFYFQLDPLLREIEKVLRNCQTFDLDLAVEHIAGLALNPLPVCMTSFLARAFHKVSTNDSLIGLPHNTIRAIVTSPELRISCDLQLALFIAAAHQRRPFSPHDLEELKACVAWNRLQSSDWGCLRWRVFFSSEEERKVAQAIPREVGSIDAMLRRYDSPPVAPISFGLEDNFFDNPGRFGASVTSPPREGRLQIVIAPLEGGKISLSRVVFVMTSADQVLEMCAICKPCPAERRPDFHAFPEPLEGKVKFTIEFNDETMYDKIVIRFPVAEPIMPVCESRSASGKIWTLAIPGAQ